jgi:hypothetical protein
MQLKVHFRGTEMWVNEVCHLNGKTLSREDYQLFVEEERKKEFFSYLLGPLNFLSVCPRYLPRGNTRYIYVFLTNWRVAVMAANI